MSQSSITPIFDEQQSATKGILHQDGHENPVEGFTKETSQEVVFWVICVFSFGLIYLVFLFLKVYAPYYAAQMRYHSVPLVNATMIVVQDVRNNKFEFCEVHTVTIEHNSGDTAPSMVSIHTSSDGGENDETTQINSTVASNRVCEVSEITYVTFGYCRYIYSRPFNSFYPLTGLDGDNPMKRPTASLNGLKSGDVRTLQKIYGTNETKITSDGYMKIFTENVMDAFYGFQIFTLILWTYAGFYWYSGGVILVSGIIIGIALHKMKRNEKRLKKELEFTDSVTVIRDAYQYYISYKELVPGDIVVLNKSARYLTFDGIILEGAIFADNALLTGVTRPSYRYSSTDSCVDINAKFNKLSLTEQNNSVFAGTYMDVGQTEGDVLALVVNTGFLTNKGKVIREAQSADMYAYSLDKDNVTYFKFLLTIGVVAFGVALIIFWTLPEDFDQEASIVASLRLITLAIPPSLPLALTVAFLWSMRRLTREHIATRNFRRINVSGKVQCIVFDKTGTLTKNKMEYVGHLAVYTEDDKVQLSEVNSSSDIEKGDVLYLMACCHSLSPIKNSEMNLDRAMFNVTEWDLVGIGGTENVRVYSGRSDNLGEFKIDILKKFPFHSERQRQSVIAHIVHENRITYYAKGLPSAIMSCCDPESIPPFTSEKLISLTKSGFRVLAMAKKEIVSEDEKRLDYKDIEVDMKFLGFLVFGDKLDEDAAKVITTLHSCKFSTVMCTGDDINTAVYIARQVGILPEAAGIGVSKRVVVLKARTDKSGNLEIEAYDYDDGTEYHVASAWGESWEPPNYVIDGETWHILDEAGGSELDRILLAGIVYAEMKPKYKKALVELLHKIGYETCMVGDGSNDNEALRAADVGISLRNTESGLAAHFHSKTNDIKSVPVILNEGRTALAQYLTILMFTACYSVLAMVAETMMYSCLYELSEAEWIYIDLFLVMSIDLMLGYSESRKTIATSRRSRSFFNTTRLFSMFCFLIVCIAVQVGLIYYLKEQIWYEHVPTSFEELTEGSMESTYIFFLIIFQLTFPAIVYTMETEPVYKNTFMLILLAVLYVINAYLDLFSASWINDIFEFDVSPSIWFRVQILLFALANLIVNILVELVFIFYRSRR